jgi:hypothetical protein
VARKLKDNDEQKDKSPDEQKDIENRLEEKTSEDKIMIPIVLTNNPRAKKLTIPKQKEFLQSLIDDWNVAKASHKIGVTRQSVYEFLGKNEGFRKAFEEIKQSHLDEIEMNLMERGKGHNFTPGIFMLKAYRPERFGDKPETAIQINVSSEHALTKLKNLLDKPTSALPVEPVLTLDDERRG